MREGLKINHMTIILQFFPNGEFSQGVTTSGKRVPRRGQSPLQTSLRTQIYTNADIERCKEQHADIPHSVYATEGYVFKSKCGKRYTITSLDTGRVTLRLDGDISQWRDMHIDTGIGNLVHCGLLFPIGSSDARILMEAPRSRKKLLSMSRNMGRNLRNAIYLLEETYGKEQLSFLTLTLPNLSKDGLSSCCSNWDVMVNTFTKWLRSRLASSLLELEYGYCTEIQPGRLRNRGEYAPHLHIIFRGRSRRNAPWAISYLECRAAWADIISRFVNEPFDTRALENIQQVRKSAARYLSKYISKGKNSIPEGCGGELAIDNLHTQWGGMSRNLSRAIKKRIIRFCAGLGLSSLASEILANMDYLIDRQCVRYFGRKYISFGVCAATGSEVGIWVGTGAFCEPTHISLPICLQLIAEMSSSADI